MDVETGEPSDKLTDVALKFCKSVGSEATTVSEILSTKDEKIMKAIQDGVDRANKKAVSRAQKVHKNIAGNEMFQALEAKKRLHVCAKEVTFQTGSI